MRSFLETGAYPRPPRNQRRQEEKLQCYFLSGSDWFPWHRILAAEKGWGDQEKNKPDPPDGV